MKQIQSSFSYPYLTMSPSRTRRLLLTTRLTRILSSVTVSSERTMQTVSRLFLPLSMTVSPRKSWSSSILAWRFRQIYGLIINENRSLQISKPFRFHIQCLLRYGKFFSVTCNICKEYVHKQKHLIKEKCMPLKSFFYKSSNRSRSTFFLVGGGGGERGEILVEAIKWTCSR